MSQQVYRIGAGYWLLSTSAVVALLTILGVVTGGIPGFPHFAKITARWQKMYSVRHYDAVGLAVVWMIVIGFFAYVTLKTARALVRPKLVRGILQSVSKSSASEDRMFSIDVSGSRHRLRHDRDLCSRLESADVLGALVDIRVGVGNRVVALDVVEQSGRAQGRSYPLFR